MKVKGIIILTLLVSGCSGSDAPERFEVSGTVTFDGDPVSHASLQFLPDSGPATFGFVKNGKFKIAPGQGVVAGPSTLEITVYEPPTPEQEAKGADGKEIGTVTRTLTVASGQPTVLQLDLKRSELGGKKGGRQQKEDEDEESEEED